MSDRGNPLDYTGTTSDAKCYQVVHNATRTWALALVRPYSVGGPQPRNGIVMSIISDWGNYSYHWTHVGPSGLAFLCGLDYHYFMTKCHTKRGKTFDLEGSIKMAKQVVLEGRRSGEFDHEEAREVFDKIKDVDTKSDYWEPQQRWYDFIGDDVHLYTYAVDGGLVAYKDDIECRGFWDNIMPMLRDIWTKELSAGSDDPGRQTCEEGVDNPAGTVSVTGLVTSPSKQGPEAVSR